MRYNLKIETGTYTGNSLAKEITACDGPDIVLGKRINGAATPAVALWRRMPRNGSNQPSGTGAEKTAQLTDLTKDGFFVGTGQSQNAALYAYLAIKASRSCPVFQTGRFAGDATDNRSLSNTTNPEGCHFQPDWVHLHRATDGQTALFRTSAHAGDSSGAYNGIQTNNRIQSFIADGFTVGNNAAVNPAAGNFVNWFALKQLAGAIKISSFVGTGAAQSIIGLGFTPTFVLVKNIATTDDARILTSGMVSNSIASITVGSGDTGDATGISSLDADGFSVGVLAGANGSANTIVYIAMADGEYVAPITRTAA